MKSLIFDIECGERMLVLEEIFVFWCIKEVRDDAGGKAEADSIYRKNH
jgi:hypothetical protein